MLLLIVRSIYLLIWRREQYKSSGELVCLDKRKEHLKALQELAVWLLQREKKLARIRDELDAAVADVKELKSVNMCLC